MHICLEPAGFLRKSRKGGHILHLDSLEPGLAERREIQSGIQRATREEHGTSNEDGTEAIRMCTNLERPVVGEPQADFCNGES